MLFANGTRQTPDPLPASNVIALFTFATKQMQRFTSEWHFAEVIQRHSILIVHICHKWVALFI